MKDENLKHNIDENIITAEERKWNSIICKGEL